MPLGVCEMFSVPSLDPATCERLAWTLVHFCWQGVALAVALAAVLAVMRLRQTRPRFRYMACCACLICMAAAPVVTYLCIDRSIYDPGPLVLPAALQASPSASPAPQLTWGQRAAFQLRSNVRYYAAPLTMTWAAAVGALGLFQLARLALLRRSVRATSSELPANWEGLRSIPSKVGVAYPVSIVVSTLVDAPATLGWLKPVVLIPASILSGLSVDVVEALVAHELAHVRRWDYLVNLLQAALETLLWWHPAVWWVNRKVRDEREHCCDELAAGVSGGRVKYAKALTALEDLRVRTPQFAMGAQGGSLVARVTRLVGGPLTVHKRRNRGGVAAVFAAIAMAMLLTAPPARGIDQVQSLCGKVYDIFGIRPIAGGDKGWLRQLDVVVAQDKGPERRPAEEQLVDAILSHSAPDQLAKEILARTQLAAMNAYQKSPDWTHGTLSDRRALSDLLWQNAKALHAEGNADRAAAYGRAATLLTAQEFAFNAASLHYLVSEPEFGQVTRLDDRQAVQLRRHVADHDAIGDAFYRHFALANTAIKGLTTSTDPAEERRVTDLIDLMVTLLRDRPDLQRQTALTAARLFAARSSPLGTSATTWARNWGARLPAEAHFARWMEEAAANPSKVAPPLKMISSESLRSLKHK